MGLFDHADDLGQNGLATHGGGSKSQRALLVDSTANDFAADGLGHRDRLAGDHGFIDIAVALDHLTVHGHALTGAYLDDVTGDDLGNGDFQRLAVAADTGGLGLKTD